MRCENTARNSLLLSVVTIGVIFVLFVISDGYAAEQQVPLYGLFETSITNTTPYGNPFADVELNAVFTSPSGRSVSFFGFHDGDGNGGQTGNVWKQRFMPDEFGNWTYVLTFSDGSPGKRGSFECVSAGAKPGPWRQDPGNPRWLMTARGEHFLPIAAGIVINIAPIDWQDAINWIKVKGYNTILAATLNAVTWGDNWPNPTPFIKESGSPIGPASGSNKRVNYEFLNIKMWKEWDDMIQAAGDENIYISANDAPLGYWGGQSGVGTIYPPTELAYFPKKQERFDTQHNLRVLRYFVARQAAFWNLANWALYPGEIFDIKGRSEVVSYGEYLASITPFNRMITSQDIEQEDMFGTNRTWLSSMNFSSSRKLNAVQTGGPDSSQYQNAGPNNTFALSVYNRGFPVLATESLWEGQARSNKPLRIIWGNFAAGVMTAWGDWSPELGDYGEPTGGRWTSMGRGWIPIKPLSEHQFETDKLGADTVGDEQLPIAMNAMAQLEYWRMSPHNELVAGSTEAYCLAEPGVQYMIYTPNGGAVKIDLTGQAGAFEVKWLNPRDGSYLNLNQIEGNAVRTTYAPTNEDWVLFLHKTYDAQAPSVPTNLSIVG